MGMLSQEKKMDILQSITLEDDCFFSTFMEGSTECAALMLRNTRAR